MLFLRSYASFSTFYHAGNSSSHSFGWPPVLVSFSVWSSVIHSISFFYHLFLYCSPMPIFVVFPQATPSKDKLNTKAGPYCDQIQGTYFLSSFLSHHRDPTSPAPLAGSGGPVLHATKICCCFSNRHDTDVSPCRALANTSGFECWLLGKGIGHWICTYINLAGTICTHVLGVEWLGQTSTAESSASWPCFLPNPNS